MKIQHFFVGPIVTNCYLLIDEKTQTAALIDPGEEAAMLASVLYEKGVTLACILLTHGHYDHTTAVAELHRAFRAAKVYIHRADVQGTRLFPLPPEADYLSFCGEGDSIPIGSLQAKVLHTPGHTPGGLCYLVERTLFTGDTLFAGSCGRTDLEGGSDQEMMASLRRLALLPGDYEVLPGHEDPSTLEQERQTNPYLKFAMRKP